MKKNLFKTIIIGLCALALTGGIVLNKSETVFANNAPNLLSGEEEVEVRGIFKELNDQKCINLERSDNSDGEDAKYIITIIEEPLTTNLGGNADVPGDDFRQRICYRHVIRYKASTGRIEDNETTSHQRSELSKTGCHEKLQKFANEKNEVSYFCKPILVILSKGGTTMLYNYIGMIYRWGVSMVGIIAVLIIVISGIQISMAGGEAEAVTSAKKRIMQSLSGIAVLILSSLILYTINPDFFIR
jgi:hypothetical protein